jgi:hypothetical protein
MKAQKPIPVALISLAGLAVAGLTMAMSLAEREAWNVKTAPTAADYPLVSGGRVIDGPLVELDPFRRIKSPTGDVQLEAAPVRFADTAGEWRVLVFLTINPVEPELARELKLPGWMLGKSRDQSNALFLYQLKEQLAGLPKTELWVVRMNHNGPEGQDPYRIFGGPGTWFWTTCVAPRASGQRPCYDRFIYAAYDQGGPDGLYFFPQRNWFYTAFPYFLTAADQGPGTAAVIIAPSGKTYFDVADDCWHEPGGRTFGACGRFGEGSEIRSVRIASLLETMDLARVAEGYPPILRQAAGKPVPSFESFALSSAGIAAGSNRN